MGFPYALRVELASPTKPELQLLLDPGLQTGELITSENPFIQHLNCI